MRSPSALVLSPVRPRLRARLDRFTDLMVVQAPPGFGKTTLVERWVAARRADGPQVHTFTSGALQPEELTGIDAGAVVVVDDVDHLLPSTSALLDLVAGEPSVRVLACGSDTEELRRSAWRRGIQVSTLDADDLAATAPELQVMAREWGHDLESGSAAALHAVTGGWPVIARLLLDGRGSDADEPDLDVAVDYLEAVVLDAMEHSTRQAAETLALVDEITACHIGVVAAEHDPPVRERQLIYALERAGVLQRRPEDSGWSILPVLSHAIRMGRHGLTESAGRQWHHKFARALQTEDEEANVAAILRHARAGEEWEVLAELWTRYGLGLVDRCPDAVVEAYRDPPQGALDRWPYLAVPAAVVAWTTKDRRYPDVYRALCNAMRPLAASYRARAEEEMAAEERLAGVSAVLVIDRMDGQLRRALEGAAQAHAEVAPMIGNGPTTMRYAWFLMQWAMTALMAADWRRALQMFADSFDAAHGIRGAEFIAANGAANAALLTAFDGSTQEARRWLGQYQHYTDPTRLSHEHASRAAELAEAILAMDALDAGATERHLYAAGDLSTDLELWPYHLYVRTQQALAFGDPVGVLSSLDRIRTTHSAQAQVDGAGQRVLHRMEVDLLLAIGAVNRAQVLLANRTEPWLTTSHARLHLITGDVERARYWASSSTWFPTVTGRDRLDRLMIEAVAAEEQDLTRRADHAFRQALALADEMRTLRNFALVPRDVLDRLLARSPGRLTGNEMHRIRASRQVFPGSVELITLSTREQVVLEQMTRFDNIREIAEELTVSPNTVKKQVVAVYSKLSVHDRESALLEAHRLGLISH